MIARAWLPVQRFVSDHRLLGFVVSVAAIAGLLAASCSVDAACIGAAGVATIVVGAFGFAATSRDRGKYALGVGSAFAWVAVQFAAIGQAPSLVGAIPLVAAALVVSAFGLPLLVSAHAAPTTAAPRRLPVPVTRAPRIVALVAVVAAIGFALLASAAEGPVTSAAVAAPSRAATGWGHIVAWVVCWELWRQRPAQTVGPALVLIAAQAVLAAGAGTEAAALGVALAVPVATVHAADRRLSPAPVALVAGLVFAWLAVLGHFAEASIAAAMSGAVALPRVVPSVRRAPRGASPSVDEALRSVARRLFALPPYDRWYGMSKLRVDPVYAALADRLADPGRVLDIGCGAGLIGGIAFARAAADASVHYDGIDLDPDKLAAAETLLAPGSASSPDGSDLGARTAMLRRAFFPDGLAADALYDTIVMLDCLHYQSADGQRRMLRAAAERLRPGGRLFVREAPSDASSRDVESGERWTTFFGLNPPGEIHFQPRAWWDAAFADLGLELVSAEQSGAQNVLFQLVASGSTQR